MATKDGAVDLSATRVDMAMRDGAVDLSATRVDMATKDGAVDLSATRADMATRDGAVVQDLSATRADVEKIREDLGISRMIVAVEMKVATVIRDLVVEAGADEAVNIVTVEEDTEEKIIEIQGVPVMVSTMRMKEMKDGVEEALPHAGICQKVTPIAAAMVLQILMMMINIAAGVRSVIAMMTATVMMLMTVTTAKAE
jgi:hypothetical protein